MLDLRENPGYSANSHFTLLKLLSKNCSRPQNYQGDPILEKSKRWLTEDLMGYSFPESNKNPSNFFTILHY